MTKTSIGGPLGWQQMAQLMGDRPDQAARHRPRDRRAYQREAHRLAGTGLQPQDIADALHLSPAAVRGLLAETPGEFARRHRHRGTP